MNKEIIKITKYLFDCDFFDDNFDPEDHEIHLDAAYKLQESFLWNDIIAEWHNYLFTNCKTPEEVINYANLFFYYGGANDYNPNPYKFLGYLYAHVDMDKYWDRAGDLFDSIAIDLLSEQLLIDIVEDPYYNPLKDPKVLEEIENWRHQ